MWQSVRECSTVGFLCAVSYLSWTLCSLSVPDRSKRSGKPLPGLRSKRWDSCIGFPSLAFPYGERDYLRPSLDMNCLLALWPLLFFVSLVTPGKAWSFDLYLKKLSCNMVYILTQNSIKHPYSIRLGSLCSSFSLSFCLISWSVKASCITRGILPPFLLSLSYRRLWTTRFQSTEGPQQVAPRTGTLVCVAFWIEWLKRPIEVGTYWGQ